MSESTAHFTTVSIARQHSSVPLSLALVVGFWWAATGLTLAMQWSHVASVASIVVTSVLALVGAALIATTRKEASALGARMAFLGSAFIWWWCSSLFYAGYGVNITAPKGAAAGSAALAGQAIMATLPADMLGVLSLAAIAIAVAKAPNKVALWSLAAFFGTLQTAKLNVFFGVRNSGVDWLPSHLSALAQFFGPTRNSALLPVTVLLLTVITAALMRGSRRAQDDYHRHAYAMLALLVGLAVVEHIFLGVAFTLPLWDAFLVHN